MLAEGGADLNIKTNNVSGHTALHICCKLDRKVCGKMLIDNGANIDPRDNFGNNPTFWANSRQNFEIVKYLGLNPSKSASVAEFLSLALLKNPMFQLPSIQKKKKKGKDDKKGGGKKKK